MFYILKNLGKNPHKVNFLKFLQVCSQNITADYNDSMTIMHNSFFIKLANMSLV